MDSFSRVFIVNFEQELAWNQISDYWNNNCSDSFEQLLEQRFVTRSIFNKDAFLLHTYFPADVSVEIYREIIPKSAEICFMKLDLQSLTHNEDKQTMCLTLFCCLYYWLYTDFAYFFAVSFVALE